MAKSEEAREELERQIPEILVHEYEDILTDLAAIVSIIN